MAAAKLRLTQVETLRVIATSPAAAAAMKGTAANGYVVARTRAALSADSPGRIVELNVIEGSVMKKGDVVARLYFDEAEAALRAADADVVAQQASIVRMQADRAVTASEIRSSARKARVLADGNRSACTLLPDSAPPRTRVNPGRCARDTPGSLMRRILPPRMWRAAPAAGRPKFAEPVSWLEVSGPRRLPSRGHRVPGQWPPAAPSFLQLRGQRRN